MIKRVTYLPSLFLFICLAFTACKNTVPAQSNEEKNEDKLLLSWFLAGHAYGAPEGSNMGMYPPLLSFMPNISLDSMVEFVVLAGDFVRTGDSLHWAALTTDAIAVGKTVYAVPGNHDYADREAYERAFGYTSIHFKMQNDLFLMFDANQEAWSITEDQMKEFEVAVRLLKPFKNIHIITHQAVWWNEEKGLGDPGVNSTQGKGDDLNIWSTLVPMLDTLNADIHFYSGDFGALPRSANCFYHNEGKFHFYGSGMGDGDQDNVLRIDSYESGEVKVSVLYLDKAYEEIPIQEADCNRYD